MPATRVVTGIGPSGVIQLRAAPTSPGDICVCFDPGMTEDQGDRHQASTSIDIDAPPEHVWRALTEPALVTQYMHGTELRTDWTEGGPITWSGEWQGRPYQDKGVVLRFEPPRVVSVTHWSPLTGDPDAPENYHHVTYELSPRDAGGTRLTLVHGNSPSEEAAQAMIENGWRPMLESLKRVAEDTAH